MGSRVRFIPTEPLPTHPEATPARHGPSSTSDLNSMCQSIDVSRYSRKLALKASTIPHLPRLILSCRSALPRSPTLITDATDGRRGDAGVYRLREASRLQNRRHIHEPRTADRRLPSAQKLLFTSDSSRHFSTLQGCQYSPEGPWHTPEHSQPAFVASRFSESSLSPFARTCPQKAKVVEVGSALPSASTSTMLICTDA